MLSLPAASRAAEALSVDLTPKAQKGQGQPELVVKANVALAKVLLDVKRSTDGRRVKSRAGPLLPGRAHTFQLPLKKIGAARFDGSLSVELDDGQTGSMPIAVEVELLGPLKVEVRAEDLDTKARVVVLSASRPATKVEVTVMSDTGAEAGPSQVELAALEDGRYRLSYPAVHGTVMKVGLQVFDEAGFHGGVDLFPWKVEIPHEDVNFRSGKHDIDAAEVKKLDEALMHLRAAIAKYGKLASVRLFIAGHTDTVGDAASNQALSDRRARAIARWFKGHGVKIPVYAAGFGERFTVVETPDETDEVRNRRAEYIVAVTEPRVGGHTVKWRRVR